MGNTQSQKTVREALASPLHLLEDPADGTNRAGTSAEPDDRSHRFRFWLNKDDSLDESDSNTSVLLRDEALNLSVDSIKQIQNLWSEAVAQGMHEPGASILKSLTFRCPEVVQIFNYVQMDLELKKHAAQIASGKIKHNPNWQPHDPLDFSIHGKRINDVIGKVIKNLPINEEINRFLLNIGQKHYCGKQFGFNPKVWDTFAECLVAKAVHWGGRNEKKVANAWFSIIIHIVKTMKRGYHIEERKQEGWAGARKSQ